MHDVEQLAWQIRTVISTTRVKTQEQNVGIATSRFAAAIENIRARDRAASGLVDEVEAEREQGDRSGDDRRGLFCSHGRNLTFVSDGG